jgi:hypothetical protein
MATVAAVVEWTTEIDRYVFGRSRLPASLPNRSRTERFCSSLNSMTGP